MTKKVKLIYLFFYHLKKFYFLQNRNKLKNLIQKELIKIQKFYKKNVIQSSISAN